MECIQLGADSFLPPRLLKPTVTSSTPPMSDSYKTFLFFSCQVMSDCLQPHGLQPARLPCPSPAPGVCSNSCPLSWWYHLTISSSATLFSSCYPNHSQYQGLFQWVSSSHHLITFCSCIVLEGLAKHLTSAICLAPCGRNYTVSFKKENILHDFLQNSGYIASLQLIKAWVKFNSIKYISRLKQLLRITKYT